MTRAPQFNRPRRRDAALPPGPDPAPDKGPLPLPHERDQATGEVAARPDPTIRQAKRDLDAGLVDTDMRATPGLDAARREALVPGGRPASSSSDGGRGVGAHPQTEPPAADSHPQRARRG